jgi:hypothetical protein
MLSTMILWMDGLDFELGTLLDSVILHSVCLGSFEK